MSITDSHKFSPVFLLKLSSNLADSVKRGEGNENKGTMGFDKSQQQPHSTLQQG